MIIACLNRVFYIIYRRLIFHCKVNKGVELCILGGGVAHMHVLTEFVLHLNTQSQELASFDVSFLSVSRSIYPFIQETGSVLVLSRVQNVTEYLPSRHAGAISLRPPHQQSAVNLANVGAIGELPNVETNQDLMTRDITSVCVGGSILGQSACGKASPPSVPGKRILFY